MLQCGENLLKHQNNGRPNSFVHNIDAVVGHCHVNWAIINII